MSVCGCVCVSLMLDNFEVNWRLVMIGVRGNAEVLFESGEKKKEINKYYPTQVRQHSIEFLAFKHSIKEPWNTSTFFILLQIGPSPYPCGTPMVFTIFYAHSQLHRMNKQQFCTCRFKTITQFTSDPSSKGMFPVVDSYNTGTQDANWINSQQGNYRETGGRVKMAN